VSAQICGYRLYKPFHEEEERSHAGRVETCVGCPACGDQLVTYLQRGRWCVRNVGWWWLNQL